MTQDEIIEMAIQGHASTRDAIRWAMNQEREACAKVCEEKQTYSMPISCPDGISGCLVAHYIPARREKTGSEAAAAIRARGEKA